MLICTKMGRSEFSSLNDFTLRFWLFFFSFSLSIWLLDRFAVLLQIASSSSSTILAYLSFFQNFLRRSEKFIGKRREPDSFRCKPFWLKCLLMIFLLSTMSKFNCSRWLVNWFTVSVAFPLSERSVGVEINTLQSGNLSCISDLKFRSLFNISLDVEWYASCVPAWTMMWLGFFWSNGMIWWFKSSTVAPGKFLTLTFQPPPHNTSSKIPLMIESPTINVAFFGLCPFSVVIFSLEAALLCTLFLDR